MNILASKRYQRVTNLALAALLVVSTITASVPFLFSEKAAAVNDTNSTITAAATCNDQGNVVVTVAGRNNGGGTLTAIVKVGSETDPIATSPVTTIPYPEEDVRIAVPTNLTSIAAGSAFADVWVTPDVSAPAPYSYEGTYNAITCPTPAPTPVVTNYTQLRNATQAGRVDVTLTFSQPIVASSLGQGWYEVGSTKTVFTKAYYSSKAFTVTFTSAAGKDGSYTFTIDATTPQTPTAQNPNGWTETANGFAWSNSGDTGTAVHYTLQYSRTHENNVAENEIKNVATNSVAVALADGPLIWRVKAIDAVGNESAWSNLQYANIDGTAPVVEFVGTTPTPNAFVKGNVSIQTKVTDMYLGAYNLRIENGAPNPLSLSLDYLNAPVSGATNTYLWNTKAGSDGQQTLLATARDVIGHKTTITRNLIVDNTAPVIATNPSINAVVNGVKTFTITQTEVNPGTLYVEYMQKDAGGVWRKVQGQEFAGTNTANFTVNTAGWVDGLYQVKVSSKDKAGNTDGDSFNVTVDNTVPAPVAGFPDGTLNKSQVPSGFTWTQPTADAHGPLTYKVITAVSGHGSDDGILKSGTQYVNSEGITGTSLAHTFTDGTFYWQVEATDTLGNKAYSNIRAVTIDATASNVPFVEKGAITYLSAAEPTKNISWTHDGVDLASFEYREYINEAAAIADNAYWTPSVSKNDRTKEVGGSWGTQTLYYAIVAIDAVGNRSERSNIGTIIIDRGTPTITVNDIAPNATRVTGTASEAATITLTVGEKTASTTINAAGNWSIELPQLADGNYTVSVVAKDVAGNITKPATTKQVKIDTSTPTADITVPVVTLVRDTTPTIAGTYTTDQFDDTTVTLFIDGDDEGIVLTDVADGEWSYSPATTLAQGDHTFFVTAKDAVHSATTSNTLTLTIDTLAPALTVSPVTDQTGTPTVTGTAEAGSVLTVTFNGQTTTIANNNGNYTFTSPTALANGDYTFLITATDAAGNATNRSAVVTVAVPASATTATPAAVQTFSVAPTIVSPSAVLGATDTASNNDGAAEVKGTTTDNFAAIDVNNNDGKIFGLAWFWWILILAAIAAAAWWIIGAARRRNENNA